MTHWMVDEKKIRESIIDFHDFLFREKKKDSIRRAEKKIFIFICKVSY